MRLRRVGANHMAGAELSPFPRGSVVDGIVEGMTGLTIGWAFKLSDQTEEAPAPPLGRHLVPGWNEQQQPALKSGDLGERSRSKRQLDRLLETPVPSPGRCGWQSTSLGRPTARWLVSSGR
jgi:hypothetical protein